MKKVAEIGWIAIGLIALVAICGAVGFWLGVGATCLVVNSVPGGMHCSIDSEDWHYEATK